MKLRMMSGDGMERRKDDVERYARFHGDVGRSS
jgi:hypothetical protein